MKKLYRILLLACMWMSPVVATENEPFAFVTRTGYLLPLQFIQHMGRMDNIHVDDIQEYINDTSITADAEALGIPRAELIYTIVEKLAKAFDIPMPAVMLLDGEISKREWGKGSKKALKQMKNSKTYAKEGLPSEILLTYELLKKSSLYAISRYIAHECTRIKRKHPQKTQAPQKVLQPAVVAKIEDNDKLALMGDTKFGGPPEKGYILIQSLVIDDIYRSIFSVCEAETLGIPEAELICAMAEEHAKALGIQKPHLTLLSNKTSSRIVTGKAVATYKSSNLFLTIGALKNWSLEEISGAIAHGCARIKCGHEKKECDLRRVLRVGITIGGAAVPMAMRAQLKNYSTTQMVASGIALGALTILMVKKLGGYALMKYKWSQVFEADKVGSYDAATTHKLIAWLKTLPEHQRAWMSTHPAPQARINALNKHLNALSAQQNPALAGA